MPFTRFSRFGYLGIAFTSGTASYLFIPNTEQKNKNYTKADVAKHKSASTGIWVSYGPNVYDITQFVEQHPGGAKILLGAGKAIDPYWHHYRQHLKPEVQDILSQYKIGTLIDYDPEAVKKLTNPYLHDPDRDSALSYHSVEPCNAEAFQGDHDHGKPSFITPNEWFFVRNHHPVPDIDVKSYRVEIEGLQFSLDDLKKFKTRNVTTTIQCGGNRRNELNKYGKTSGTPWCGGAMSTAKWTGCFLRDVIFSTDKNIIESERCSGKWVTIKSNDDLEISIPIEKVLDPNGDVLLAWEMNGEQVPRDHGYPIRLIVPGFVGIRNVKWVSSITITDNEVDSNWQTGIAYKMLPHFQKKVDKNELKKLKTTQEPPVQSFITTTPESMLEQAEENDGRINIFGYAWSGGGRGIQRVEISEDGGETWQLAELQEGKEQNMYKAWAWTLFKYELKLENRKVQDVKLRCRAVDVSYNTQPEDTRLVWNVRGINNNSWHKLDLVDFI